MCQFKASRYKKGLRYMKNWVTTNQKHTVDSQKTKIREQKHLIKRNLQTTKGKTSKKKNKRRNRESTGKQGLKCQ